MTYLMKERIREPHFPHNGKVPKDAGCAGDDVIDDDLDPRRFSCSSWVLETAALVSVVFPTTGSPGLPSADRL